MSLGDNPVPTSVKKIRLTLQPLEEVKESEDFMALQTKLNTETEALHRHWANTYSIVVDMMNCDASLRLLHHAPRGFIAHTGLNNYNEHTAVIDLIALHRHNILTSHYYEST